MDELGDVLFQVHFLALLLEERGAGSLAEVAEAMSEKLIRRHPHVFGDARAETAGEVLRNWDRIKREQEGRGADEPFADVPENLPALLYARKIQRRAASAGLEGDEPGSEEPGDEEPGDDEPGAEEPGGDEPGAPPDTGRRVHGPAGDPALRDAAEAWLGDTLFSLVDVARRMRIDPELALRAAAQRFRDRFE